MKFNDLFSNKKPIIGMVHVDALPGTPNYKGPIKNIIKKAVSEAIIYEENGFDGIIIENMHDVPYLKRNVGDEITSMISVIAYEIKTKIDLPLGIQILAGANKQALAAAKASGANFIRAEGNYFAHIADEGIFSADAGELLRYRKQIDAEDIFILSDIKKKHSSNAITNDVDIVETAKAAEFFLSDGVIITGSSTGKEADVVEIIHTKKSVSIPVLVGSGINPENIERYLRITDGLIVGSSLKKDGLWFNSVDSQKVASLMKVVYDYRKK